MYLCYTIIVISFAGDALICVFYPPHFDSQQRDHLPSHSHSQGEDSHSRSQGWPDRGDAMMECCQRALECAMQLVKHVTEDLTSHIAIRLGVLECCVYMCKYIYIAHTNTHTCIYIVVEI